MAECPGLLSSLTVEWPFSGWATLAIYILSPGRPVYHCAASHRRTQRNASTFPQQTADRKLVMAFCSELQQTFCTTADFQIHVLTEMPPLLMCPPPTNVPPPTHKRTITHHPSQQGNLTLAGLVNIQFSITKENGRFQKLQLSTVDWPDGVVFQLCVWERQPDAIVRFFWSCLASGRKTTRVTCQVVCYLCAWPGGFSHLHGAIVLVWLLFHWDLSSKISDTKERAPHSHVCRRESGNSSIQLTCTFWPSKEKPSWWKASERPSWNKDPTPQKLFINWLSCGWKSNCLDTTSGEELVQGQHWWRIIKVRSIKLLATNSIKTAAWHSREKSMRFAPPHWTSNQLQKVWLFDKRTQISLLPGVFTWHVNSNELGIFPLKGGAVFQLSGVKFKFLHLKEAKATNCLSVYSPKLLLPFQAEDRCSVIFT